MRTPFFIFALMLALIGLSADSNKSAHSFYKQIGKVQDRNPRTADDQVRMMRMLLDMPPDRLQVIKKSHPSSGEDESG